MYVLEVMAHNLHVDDCPAHFYLCWNTTTKRNASGLLQAITNFEFVVTFVIGYLYLSHMSVLTTKLQRKSNDIFKAFTMVSSVLKSYQDMRADMDEMNDDAYEKAMAMAAKVGVVPTAPIVAGRQRHRTNAPAPTAKEYYRINVAAPFLDHIILQLGERFDARHRPSLKAACFYSLCNERESNEVARVTRGGGYVQGRSSISTALPGRISAVENQVCRGGRDPGLVCHSPEAVRRG